jgi:hypothetical protein
VLERRLLGGRLEGVPDPSDEVVVVGGPGGAGFDAVGEGAHAVDGGLGAVAAFLPRVPFGGHLLPLFEGAAGGLLGLSEGGFVSALDRIRAPRARLQQLVDELPGLPDDVFEVGVVVRVVVSHDADVAEGATDAVELVFFGAAGLVGEAESVAELGEFGSSRCLLFTLEALCGRLWRL